MDIFSIVSHGISFFCSFHVNFYLQVVWFSVFLSCSLLHLGRPKTVLYSRGFLSHSQWRWERTPTEFRSQSIRTTSVRTGRHPETLVQPKQPHEKVRCTSIRHSEGMAQYRRQHRRTARLAARSQKGDLQRSDQPVRQPLKTSQGVQCK